MDYSDIHNMNIALFFVLIFAASGLLLILWALKSKYAISDENKTKKTKKSPKEKTTPCPICNSMLYPGENLITRIYEGMDAKEQRATIHGCPYCYPVPSLAAKRTCPVCHQSVPPTGHLDAFLFIRDTGKRHIHITGCTECHKRKIR